DPVDTDRLREEKARGVSTITDAGIDALRELLITEAQRQSLRGSERDKSHGPDWFLFAERHAVSCDCARGCRRKRCSDCVRSGRIGFRLDALLDRLAWQGGRWCRS